MVLTVLVVEFKLRTSFFEKNLLARVQLIDGLNTMGTVVIGTFMDGHFFLYFPAEESQPAVRAVQLRPPALPESVMDLEEITTDLALNL